MVREEKTESQNRGGVSNLWRIYRKNGFRGGKRGGSYHGWFILGTHSWGRSKNLQLESQVTQKSIGNILHCQRSKGHPSPARPGWRKLQAGLGQCYRVGWSSGEEKTFFLLWSWQKRLNWDTIQSWARTQSTLTARIHLTPNSHFMIWVQGCISLSTCRKELLAFQSSSSCLYSISGNPQPLLIKQPGACMLRLWWYEFTPWCPHISEFNILDITWEMNRGLSVKEGTSDEPLIWTNYIADRGGARG